MATLLVDLAVRAALIAAGTALILWTLRIRTAAARHAAWTTVVIAMLLLPIWSVAGPKVPLAVLPAGAASLDPGPVATRHLRAITPESSVARPGPAAAAETAPSAGEFFLVGAYLLGAIALLIRLAFGTVQAHRLRRRAVVREGRATSARCATPITVGWLSPALILPEGWERWSAARLDAVLTHEREHARRHDPLVQWLALLNRAIFWFHPMAWWLERRLANLAEEACDAAVIRAGHAPQDYSDYLIDMARTLTRQGRRLNVVGMAMHGGGLRDRMRHIFEEEPMKPLSRGRAICTLAFCAVSAVVLTAATLVPRQVTAADSPASAGARVRTDDVSLALETADPPRSNFTRQSSSMTDFSGNWSLVSATSRQTRGGSGGGGPVTHESEVNVMSKWISGAPVNCGPECSITQDAKTLTIRRSVNPEDGWAPDNGEVVLNLDGSDSAVRQPGGKQYIVNARRDGDGLVVTHVTTFPHTYPPNTVTQVLSIEDGKLKVVTVFGGNPPVTLTYVRG